MERIEFRRKIALHNPYANMQWTMKIPFFQLLGPDLGSVWESTHNVSARILLRKKALFAKSVILPHKKVAGNGRNSTKKWLKGPKIVREGQNLPKKWPKVGFGALQRPLNGSRTADMDPKWSPSFPNMDFLVQKFPKDWGLVANNAGLPKKLLHIQDSTYIYTITTCQVHVFFPFWRVVFNMWQETWLSY